MTQQDKHMLIERYVIDRENVLIERFIKDGPTAIRENLGLSEQSFRVIFDSLVFDHNLLYKTVTQASEFFVDAYVKHGMSHVRGILDVDDSKYDKIFEIIYDFLALSHEGVYYHVLEHRDRYMMAFRARGGDFVRKVLGLWKDKYDGQWRKILDLLLHSVCDDIFSRSTFDHGLRAFAHLMNGTRVHRPVEKSERFRPGLV